MLSPVRWWFISEILIHQGAFITHYFINYCKLRRKQCGKCPDQCLRFSLKYWPASRLTCANSGKILAVEPLSSKCS